jgi:hypothetical protein
MTTTTTREATPAERLQDIQSRIVQTTDRLGAIRQEYDLARRRTDEQAMKELVIESTVLEDLLPSLQCAALSAEINLMESQRADAERRREELRQSMVVADDIFRQAERAAGQALAAYRGAEEEEQTLGLRIANSRVELTQMEAEASLKAWRP